MARALLPDALWEFIEPLLPPDKPAKSNGRPATGIEGDVNVDGFVNILDIQGVVMAVLEIPMPYPTDLTGDTKTNILDVQHAVDLVLAAA